MNNIEILEKELANINNLIDYYTFENLDYDEKYRMEEFKKAIENLIKENKELKEKVKGMYDKSNKLIEVTNLYLNSIPKSKVKELAKKYEFALNGYDSSTADYKHSQNLGRYLACVELLEEGE